MSGRESADSGGAEGSPREPDRRRQAVEAALRSAEGIIREVDPNAEITLTTHVGGTDIVASTNTGATHVALAMTTGDDGQEELRVTTSTPDVERAAYIIGAGNYAAFETMRGIEDKALGLIRSAAQAVAAFMCGWYKGAEPRLETTGAAVLVRGKDGHLDGICTTMPPAEAVQMAVEFAASARDAAETANFTTH